MTTVSYPTTLSIYPSMGVEAARRRSGTGGAFRVWALAKALDQVGLGRVRRYALRAFVLSLGVNLRTWQRWISEARAHDLVMDLQKSDGTWWLVLASAGKAAAILGCETLERKVVLSPTALVGTCWKARMFAAWEHGKQISRQQIQKTINVPVRTQVYRDRQSGISHTKNYAKSKLSGKALSGVQEFTNHKAAFVTRDGFVAWRLPDYREAGFATSGRKGRARKANKIIHTAMRHEGLFLVQRALTSASERSGLARIFCETDKQLSFALAQVRAGDVRSQDLYHYNGKRTRSGAVLWDHYPTIA